MFYHGNIDRVDVTYTCDTDDTDCLGLPFLVLFPSHGLILLLHFLGLIFRILYLVDLGA